MPAIIPFIPAIIGAVGGIAAAKIQSNASNKAAELQAKSADDAMAFQGGIIDRQQRNLQPWMNSGTAALDRLNSLMRTPGQAAPGPMAGPPGMDQDFITVIAPNGMQQRRPASERAHWESKGANVAGILSNQSAGLAQLNAMNPAQRNALNMQSRGGR